MPELQLRIDANSAIPPYEQLRAQVSLLVASGRLRSGDRLPTIRALAEQLSLANGTVARAFRANLRSTPPSSTSTPRTPSPRSPPPSRNSAPTSPDPIDPEARPPRHPEAPLQRALTPSDPEERSDAHRPTYPRLRGNAERGTSEQTKQPGPCGTGLFADRLSELRSRFRWRDQTTTSSASPSTKR